MLNKDNVRELAYVVKVNAITPMDADRLECAHINGWNCVVGKGEFKPGDLAIYFEIDSKLPEVEPFTSMEFLKSKNYKIKSQKIRGVISQGLLVPVSTVDFEVKEGDFLTEKIGVTYAVTEDNTRKAPSADKYKKMAQRHPQAAKTWIWRKLWKTQIGKDILFLFFGKAKDNRGWPAWVVKTDEERVQNMPWILQNKQPWIATEKIDGTSTTFTMKRKKGLFKDKFDFYICSRNVVFDKPDKKCFYDTNHYVEMAQKYNIEERMQLMLERHPKWDWVTIQGETYGPGIQKRDYSNTDVKFRAFNFITSADGRWSSDKAQQYLDVYEIPFVPIISTQYILPDTVDELIEQATGTSVLDGLPREGIVFRSQDGAQSFKAVSNEYLLKYHQ